MCGRAEVLAGVPPYQRLVNLANRYLQNLYSHCLDSAQWAGRSAGDAAKCARVDSSGMDSSGLDSSGMDSSGMDSSVV